ncbi:hypothetical protein PybrP1_004040 [[Pythium] brassicae (nom. inval.)]|nr:hypothetical protein PybrP1_004040 [[Pythium] brassicae (nom. inval.)]
MTQRAVAVALSVLLLLAVSGVAVTDAQQQKVVTEVVSGSIFRYPTYVSVDRYSLRLAADAIVEFDILSVETADNKTFADVNRDCDSAFIDSHVHLFAKLADGRLRLVASNDDEGDDYSSYAGRGKRDGSLNAQDSYLIRRVPAGDYVFAVGRYPLSPQEAANGRSLDRVAQFSPYACHARQASYGNYRLTVRSQSTAGLALIQSSPDSYVGTSCNVPASVTKACMYRLPGDYRSAIQRLCSYDQTV